MSPRFFTLTLMALIAIVNMAINYQKVEYYFLWYKGSLPLSIVSLFSMAYGALIGILYLGYIRSTRKIRRENKELKN